MPRSCKAGQHSLIEDGKLEASKILLKYQQVTQMNNPFKGEELWRKSNGEYIKG